MTSLDVKEYSEVSVGDLSIFMEKSTGDNTVAHIFLHDKLIGEITVLSINQNDTGLYNELFSTIKKFNQDKEPYELYTAGLELLKEDKPEEAKRHFAAAVASKPDDAEFRYMLAETLALTGGYVSSAKKTIAGVSQNKQCTRQSRKTA